MRSLNRCAPPAHPSRPPLRPLQGLRPRGPATLVLAGVLAPLLAACATGQPTLAAQEHRTTHESRTTGAGEAQAAQAAHGTADAHGEEGGARLHVSGVGRVGLEPDRARVSFAVETAAPTAAEAAQANARATTAVLEALRQVGGETLELETTGFDLTPRYRRRTSSDEDQEGPVIVGYQVRNQVQVVSRDPQGIGALVDAGLAAGANRINGLSFYAVPSEAARTRAYALAVEDARLQAEAMAAALGVPLGPVAEIRGSVRDEVPANTFRGDVLMAEAQVSTPVETGTSMVTATVQITFHLGG